MTPASPSDRLRVDLRWDLRIPLRDGVRLGGMLYLPVTSEPTPIVLAMTPYGIAGLHKRGLYFAANGFAFLAVDVRGRGGSDGKFNPGLSDGPDAYDVVEWIAEQPFCNGKVAMCGGSYSGYLQWAAAAERPPHLKTIVPTAAAFFGVDFPFRSNIAAPYALFWLMKVSGRSDWARVFADSGHWSRILREHVERGDAFRTLDESLGCPSEVFQTWLSHPTCDEYWRSSGPSSSQYAAIDLPILSITGCYDADQLGALAHYSRHLASGSSSARNHHLIIGPWDHAGTANPQMLFGGVSVGPNSQVDLDQVHLDWFNWTLSGQAKPEFLKQNVTYYVMGAEQWRHSESLARATRDTRILYLDVNNDPTDIFHSGTLNASPSSGGRASYVFDPANFELFRFEAERDPHDRSDQAMAFARTGKQFVFHGAPLDHDLEITGFFRFHAWISIDQPDTDFQVTVYEIAQDGRALLLSKDIMRARYRQGLDREILISSDEPFEYVFDGFNFISRVLRRWSRIRLLIGPVDSPFYQRNYNSGRTVADETLADARPVTVTLFHDEARRSALHVPIGNSIFDEA